MNDLKISVETCRPFWALRIPTSFLFFLSFLFPPINPISQFDRHFDVSARHLYQPFFPSCSSSFFSRPRANDKNLTYLCKVGGQTRFKTCTFTWSRIENCACVGLAISRVFFLNFYAYLSNLFYWFYSWMLLSWYGTVRARVAYLLFVCFSPLFFAGWSILFRSWILITDSTTLTARCCPGTVRSRWPICCSFISGIVFESEG